MRILVTNDDGIHAEGLWALARALQPIGNVSVVAPETNFSGSGTAKTLITKIRARAARSPLDDITAFSVQGTPTDCVILANEFLFDKPFDLLISGINPGANMGGNLFSSGTFGAAWHGHTRGIPSIAISVSSITNVKYKVAATVAKIIAQRCINDPPSKPFVLNVNLPNIASRKIVGVEITHLATTGWSETVEQDPDDCESHYRIKQNNPPPNESPNGTDVWAILNNRISITPVSVDSTVHTGETRALAISIAASLGLHESLD